MQLFSAKNLMYTNYSVDVSDYPVNKVKHLAAKGPDISPRSWFRQKQSLMAIHLIYGSVSRGHDEVMNPAGMCMLFQWFVTVCDSVTEVGY